MLRDQDSADEWAGQLAAMRAVKTVANEVALKAVMMAGDSVEVSAGLWAA